MDLERVYTPNLKPIYPEATDQFLNGLPPQPTYSGPRRLAEATPSERETYLAELIKSQQFDLRSLEVAAFAIANRASTVKELIDEYPDVAASLPEELRIQIEQWASVVAKPKPYFPEMSD